jgi:nucleoside 2-deoxyribosyltransferase
MTIYLAGPWVCKPAVREARAKFEAAGIKVQADWIDGHGEALTEKDCRDQAYHDLEQIRGADALVVLSLLKSSGKESEYAFAYAWGKPTISVGNESDNIFYSLAHNTCVNTVEEAIDALYRHFATESRP